MQLRNHRAALALAAVLAFPVSGLSAEPTKDAAPACQGLVVEDGDTVKFGEEVIRLKGFDTPEVEYARCESERRLGLMAAVRLRSLICRPGVVVIVDRGPAPARDRHKRTLAVLRVDGRDVAEIMISEGFARPYNGGFRKGWCSRDSRDDLIPGPQPKGRK